MNRRESSEMEYYIRGSRALGRSFPTRRGKRVSAGLVCGLLHSMKEELESRFEESRHRSLMANSPRAGDTHTTTLPNSAADYPPTR